VTEFEVEMIDPAPHYEYVTAESVADAVQAAEQRLPGWAVVCVRSLPGEEEIEADDG
jgi:hypothetical protein